MCHITLYIGNGTSTMKIGEAYKVIKSIVKIQTGKADLYEAAPKKEVKPWLLHS